ncbi:hypothetical protein Ait01nite_036310 [Actinoplanes italicus]|uniref:SCP-2 sterol transfer family protein n=1 Tax=Actinoplanes italicus TaxID=113567 RepID=A0A2T0K8J4_9ACTN|nr:SCP2 sterol-binding domain-containing protein [Actinoplanes italicus]PRX19399.1 SCP-2 sterol transfer family protein [Actinoplanes italicus]GIE30586.1 hypothetical protein Ait01nite_036310 [Actinoplanes italicus]
MITTTDPAQDRAAFARQVKNASSSELRELLDRYGKTVLTALAAGMPDVFRADLAGPLDAVVQWHVFDRSGEDSEVFDLHIAGGRCRLAEPGAAKPRLVLHLNEVDFVKMTTGNAGARVLFLRGKLRARGDLGLVNRLPSLFDVPRP